MNKFKILLATFLLAPFFFFAPSPAPAALNAYLTIAGEATGEIVGECDIVPYVGKTEVYAFGHNIHFPYDPATGLPTGPKTHTPLQIYKLVDRTSPLLNQMMVTNDMLTTFELLFVRPSAGGPEEEYFKITLEKARIVKITPSMANNRIPDNMQLQVAETVSFTYGTITWESLLPTPVSKSDTWATP